MAEKLRIVVADDDAVVREMLRQCLIALGHEVVAVHGGRPLLAACAAAPPDVVVSDVQMPDLDGLAAAEAIRRGGPDAGRAGVRQLGPGGPRASGQDRIGVVPEQTGPHARTGRRTGDRYCHLRPLKR